jgi:hypothetical protein
MNSVLTKSLVDRVFYTAKAEKRICITRLFHVTATAVHMTGASTLFGQVRT